MFDQFPVVVSFIDHRLFFNKVHFATVVSVLPTNYRVIAQQHRNKLSQTTNISCFLYMLSTLPHVVLTCTCCHVVQHGADAVVFILVLFASSFGVLECWGRWFDLAYRSADDKLANITERHKYYVDSFLRYAEATAVMY